MNYSDQPSEGMVPSTGIRVVTHHKIEKCELLC